MTQQTVRKTDYAGTRYDRVMSMTAMQFFQDDTRFVAVKDVPIIKVNEPSGVLSVLDNADLNRDEVKLRTPDAEAEKASFKFKDVLFKTDARSIEYDVNAAVAAGATPGRDPSKVVPFALAYKANIHTEVRFAAAAFVGASWVRVVTGNAANGTDNVTTMNRKFWDDATNDPIVAIRLEQDIFLARTGMWPTAIRFGRQLFTQIASHPLVRAQVAVTVGGSQAIGSFTPPASEQQLAALLGMKVSVASAIQNTAGRGVTTATNAFIVASKSALMTYDAPQQIISEATPTAFARVVFTGLSPDGFQVRTFDRPEIGPGGSRASILDIYNGFVVVDNTMGTFFANMAQ